MSAGHVSISKHGTIVLTGDAIEAARGHALWCILRMWGRGFTDRRIRGLTKKEALGLAGEMTGCDYQPSELDRATAELEHWWKGVLSGAKVEREDD
ncbi:hypothetical protein [Bradyrhizobium sp.]|uniref:hypothetical protein n=1 Tax=Bradyrhizobium sp. TaxID=376 RepID=UPI0026373E1E|nr:hypothetical protein [Bradyrhizobium sp.]